MMKRIGPFLAALLWSAAACGQGAVLQQGGVFRAHGAMWVGNGYIADAGGPVANGLAPVDPVAGLLPLGAGWVNSGLGECQFSAYAATPFASLCWGFDVNNGNGLINYSGINGGGTLEFEVNGVIVSPFSGGGNVVGPIPPSPPPTAGNVVIWNGGPGGLNVTDGHAPPVVSVPSNAALQALSLTGLSLGQKVQRQNFYATTAVSGPTNYLLSTAGNCPSADNGMQVQPNVGTGCWYAQFNGAQAPDQWGASGSAATITCATVATNPIITCSGGVGDFVVGEQVAIIGGGVAASIAPPSLSVAAVNGSGTTYWYTIAPIDGNMGLGMALGPMSVSGGPDLGLARDMNLNLTGDTHSSNVINNLKLKGVSCTAITCPFGVGGVIVGQSLGGSIGVNNSTISAINSATSLNISTMASNTASGVNIGTASPGGGVYNQLTISGSSPSYALYEGTSPSPSSMTCMGVSTNLNTVNGGIWNDFGTAHHTICPTWIPVNPPQVATGDVLRTTITAISGNSITLASSPSQTLSATSVVHDDTVAFQNELTWAGPILLPCETYNLFNGVSTMNTPLSFLGSSCGTIAGWGSNFDDFTIGTNSSGSTFQGMIFDDNEKSGGFALFANNTNAHIVVDGLAINNGCNGIKVTVSQNPRFYNVSSFTKDAAAIRCDVGVYMYGISVPSQGVTFRSIMLGNQASSANAYCMLIDGDVNSTVINNGAMQDCPRGALVMRNTLGATVGPNYIDTSFLGINVQSGPAVLIQAGSTGKVFKHLFIQGQPGNNVSCIEIQNNSGGSVTLVDGTLIEGCDKNGVDSNSNTALLMADGTTQIFGNNQLYGNYDKVRLGINAGAANINLATGDGFSANANNATNERCGVHLLNGYGTGAPLPTGTPLAAVTTSGPGLAAAVCDDSGIAGLVAVNGLLNGVETEYGYETNTSGTTFTAPEIVTSGGRDGFLSRSGPVLNFSDQLPTLTAVTTWFPAAYVGFSFTFTLNNLTEKTETLTGNTGATVAGTATTATNIQHLFRCNFTGTFGSPPTGYTCTG